ncbi:MAG: hypothetical protein QXU32_03580 [Nitrososphaerales archaeon]
MKKSILLLISGGIILTIGFVVLSLVAQSAISEIRKKEYVLGPKEVIEINERIESGQFFSGVYAIEMLEAGESPIRMELKDPEGVQIVSREFDTPFIIDSFDVRKDGVYTMTLENTSARDVIKIAAALGGQVYSGTADPLVAVAMPTYIAITGIIIVIAGAVVYYKERRLGTT